MIEDNTELRRSNIVRNNRLAALKTSKAQASRECDLNDTKWFDYRFVSPLEATELFVNSYQVAFRREYSRCIDTEASVGMTGTRSRQWKSNSREFASFWNARQFADELGLPYWFFVHYGMKMLMSWGWKHIPRVNQLYGPTVRHAITTELQSKWDEWTDVRFVFSALPHYLPENFRALPSQLAHQEWVIEQLNRRRASPGMIGRACFVDRVLSVERTIREFGAEKVESARVDAVGDFSRAPTVLEFDQTTPSCFGVLHAPTIAAGPCKCCALQNACLELTSKVCSFVVAHAGSADPVTESRRRLGRERTRKFRAKASLASELKHRVSAVK